MYTHVFARMYVYACICTYLYVFIPDPLNLCGQRVHGPPAWQQGAPAPQQVRRQGPLPSYGGCCLCQSLSLSPTHRRADSTARSGPPPALRHEARDRTGYWKQDPAFERRMETMDPSLLDGCVRLWQSRRAEGSLRIAGAGRHPVSDSESLVRALHTSYPKGCAARQ